MSNYKIIGGEFEIVEPRNNQITPPYLENHCIYTYSSGRAALYNICISPTIRGKKILVPDYLCSSIPQVIQMTGNDYEYYSLDEFLEPNFTDCGSKVSDDTALLVINYFGCIDTAKVIRQIKNLFPNQVIILDNVQSPFSILNTSNANYSFTSFRKAYPVTDGAYVVTKDTELSQPSRRSKFSQYKLAASLLKENRDKDYYEDDIYLSLFHQGEDIINNDLDADMSNHAKAVLNELDVYRIELLRQRNAACILKGLKDMGLKPLIPINEEVTPLFVPIALVNRDNVRKKMFEKNIFCPVHWPIEIDEDRQKTGAKLSKTELSLIIDHRYSVNDMNLILGTIKENI